MSEEQQNQTASENAAKAKYAHKSKIGGQALVEGIMMKGAFRGAMACRLPNGEIDLETWDIPAKFVTDPKTGEQRLALPWYQKTPLVRGCVNFVTSMIDAYRCMMKSADKQMDEELDDYCLWKKKQKFDKLPEEEQKTKFAAWLAEYEEKKYKAKAKESKEELPPFEAPDEAATAKRFAYLEKASEHYEVEEPSKFGQWLDEKLGDEVFNIVMVLVLILSVALCLGLFLYLPRWVVSWIQPLTENRIIRSCAEGIVKMALFIAYMALTGCIKGVRRTYEFHGAEHKTIACFEAALPLTVENVRKQTRFHPRCGTSFIFLVLIISIFVGCFNPFDVTWQRVLFSLVLLPLVMGISYELIRLAGRADNAFTRILSAPGLWVQRITTKEPDDEQIQCAITAITPCIPEHLEDDEW
ncbi:MAG: DUF1385 domain-containing protein [Oscillospiraceae bacterium]|nr:DUF1385 domain-containing protein [Oscillospiraceae bacterium]